MHLSSLLPTLQPLPVIRFLPSNTGRGILQNGLLRLIAATAFDDFDLDRIKPLLKKALDRGFDDALILDLGCGVWLWCLAGLFWLWRLVVGLVCATGAESTKLGGDAAQGAPECSHLAMAFGYGIWP